MKKVGPYYDVLEKLKKWEADAPKIAIDEAEKEGDEMIILNQDDQLEKGIDNRGRKIKPAYNKLTIKIKKLKGQPTDRVTLHDEGDFYKGMHTERTGKGIYIDSTDKKTEKLVTKYGDDIFGLNKQNLKEFIDSYLKPRMQERFKKAVLG